MIEKYQQIVAMLHDLTDEGKVEWEKTSSNEYKVCIGNNYISILYHEANLYSAMVNAAPDVSFLKLLLWDQNGDILDDVKVEQREYGSIDYDNLMGLYTAARRSYGKVYDTLDGIITDLEKVGKDS